MTRNRTKQGAAPDSVDSFMPVPHLALHILLALADANLHGWAIIKRIGQLTDGRTQPSSGSLYLSMLKLEERGLIAGAKSPDSNDDARRRYYELTSLGRRVLEAETARLTTLLSHASRAGVSATTPKRNYPQ